MIAMDLSKQQVLDADPREIQQINFTANLDRDGNTTMFFIIEEARETKFFTKNCKSFLHETLLKFNLVFISITWHNRTV